MNAQDEMTALGNDTVELEDDLQTNLDRLLGRQNRGGENSAVFVSRLTGFDEDGRPLIERRNQQLVPAISIVKLTEWDVDRELVVISGPHRGAPLIILGVVQPPRAATTKLELARDSSQVAADGEKVIIRADREIELRCGDASIVLTRSGKVLIKGKHVVSRSEGANLVKGASVGIN